MLPRTQEQLKQYVQDKSNYFSVPLSIYHLCEKMLECLILLTPEEINGILDFSFYRGELCK